MSSITHLHEGNPEARARLMKSVPSPPKDFDREAFIESLPFLLESVLDLILKDFESKPGMNQSSAVGCRILATLIDRLQD